MGTVCAGKKVTKKNMQLHPSQARKFISISLKVIHPNLLFGPALSALRYGRSFPGRLNNARMSVKLREFVITQGAYRLI